jgi:hypothetical protein
VAPGDWAAPASRVGKKIRDADLHRRAGQHAQTADAELPWAYGKGQELTEKSQNLKL